MPYADAEDFSHTVFLTVIFTFARTSGAALTPNHPYGPQVWGLLPSLCTRATDTITAFKGVARVIASALMERPDLRTTILPALQTLIGTADEAGRAAVAVFAKNYLPILFNIYTSSESEVKTVCLATIEVGRSLQHTRWSLTTAYTLVAHYSARRFVPIAADFSCSHADRIILLLLCLLLPFSLFLPARSCCNHLRLSMSSSSSSSGLLLIIVILLPSSHSACRRQAFVPIASGALLTELFENVLTKLLEALHASDPAAPASTEAVQAQHDMLDLAVSLAACLDAPTLLYRAVKPHVLVRGRLLLDLMDLLDCISLNTSLPSSRSRSPFLPLPRRYGFTVLSTVSLTCASPRVSSPSCPTRRAVGGRDAAEEVIQGARGHLHERAAHPHRLCPRAQHGAAAAHDGRDAGIDPGNQAPPTALSSRRGGPSARPRAA